MTTGRPAGAACASSTPAPDVEARRLLWRCRRGMKELDVLLERFAREALASAPPEDRDAFAMLLRLADPELAACLLGGNTPADPRLARLAGRIRDLCRPADPGAVFCP